LPAAKHRSGVQVPRQAKSFACRSRYEKRPLRVLFSARETGLEPATSAVTGRRSNQLSYSRNEQYQNDYDRSRAIQSIMTAIRFVYRTQSLPSNLKTIANAYNAQLAGSSLSRVSILDPKTNEPYGYKVTSNGFEITVTFETSDAIAAARRGYSYDASTTTIEGKTVTFKGRPDSYFSFYLSPEPPKPFLVQIGEDLRFLPADFSIKGGVKGTVSFGDSSKWAFNLNGQGDFGDLSYALDIDALKNNTDYYVRISKIPSILLSTISNLKGQWIHIDATAPTSTERYGSSLSYYANYFPQLESDYRKNREKMQAFYGKALSIANDVGLIEFKNAPKSDHVDGRLVYRYDVTLKKDAILPFYQKLSDEIKKDSDLSYSTFFNDEGMVEYLQSDEFSQVYDYVNKYMSVTLWVDPQGRLAQSDFLFKGIPPDTAVQLKDKQIDVLLRLVMSNFNQGVHIDVPKETKEISELQDDYSQNLNNYAPGSTDAVKSYLTEARSAAYSWDYAHPEGGTTFGPASCSQKTGTVFETSTVYDKIAKAAGGDASNARCAASGKAYAISAPLTTAGYSWCVDSTGDSRQIKGVLVGSACK
jgi:hypothetical protein